METLTAKHFRFADFELNGAKRLLLKQGMPVALNSKTFDLLLALVERHGEVLSKDELLEKVWAGQFVEEGNLTVQISTLRKIFGETKNEHRFIVTVPGRGYSFVAELDDDAESEMIVESHSLSRIVIEEKEAADSSSAVEKNGSQTAQIGKTSASVNRKGRKFLLAAAAGMTILLVGVGGYWLYRQSNRQQNFAQGWIDQARAVNPRQLTTNGKVAFAALSPDGHHFAYTIGQTDQPSLWYANTNGKQQIQIRPPEAVTYYGLTFAPDGSEIYYVSDGEKNQQGALFRIPVLGGPPQKILSNIESPVTFSPDGRQVAFIRFNFKRKLSILVIADVAAAGGASERELATRPIEKRFTVRGASWSPDGKTIAVGVVSDNLGSHEDVFLVNTADGTAEKFGTSVWQQVRRVAWLKDGSGLFVNAIEKDVWDDRHLWLVEYPGGKTHKITQDLFHYGMFNLSVSDDGAKLLSVSSTKICNIFVSPADILTEGKKITANSLGKLAGSEGVAWTPDGRIVYGAFFDKNQTLWIMNADGTNARQLTSPGFLDMSPNVTKDNRYVVFTSTRSGSWNLWRIGLDGSDLKQLTRGQVFRSSVTPDGRWVLYGERDEKGLISIWKVSIDGGDPVRLTDKPSGFPRVSPDGKTFACSYNRPAEGKTRFAVFSIDGGEPLHVFEVPPKTFFEAGLRWTPDGQSIVYRDFGPSLWRQRLSGGAPEKILEFPDEIIYSFDWSFDGQQFAVAHGEDLRDAILITNNP